MARWSKLGDKGSKSAGSPDICIAPVLDALAPFALQQK